VKADWLEGKQCQVRQLNKSKSTGLRTVLVLLMIISLSDWFKWQSDWHSHIKLRNAGLLMPIRLKKSWWNQVWYLQEEGRFKNNASSFYTNEAPGKGDLYLYDLLKTEKRTVLKLGKTVIGSEDLISSRIVWVNTAKRTIRESWFDLSTTSDAYIEEKKENFSSVLERERDR
jgi:hypothetical protein